MKCTCGYVCCPTKMWNGQNIGQYYPRSGSGSSRQVCSADRYYCQANFSKALLPDGIEHCTREKDLHHYPYEHAVDWLAQHDSDIRFHLDTASSSPPPSLSTDSQPAESGKSTGRCGRNKVGYFFYVIVYRVSSLSIGRRSDCRAEPNGVW